MNRPSLSPELPSADAAVRASTIAILVVVLLSGPLVPSIDFTPTNAAPTNSGPDAANITVVDAPTKGFRIAPARFGAGTYLYSPDATVFVESVSGTPFIIYELRVPGLGRNEVVVAYPGESAEGSELTLELERGTVDPTAVTAESYSGTVEIRVHAGNDTRVVFHANVTVRVEGMDGS